MPTYEKITANNGLALEPDSNPTFSGSAMNVDAQIIDGNYYSKATSEAWEAYNSYGVDLGSSQAVTQMRFYGIHELIGFDLDTLLSPNAVDVYESADNSTWSQISAANPVIVSHGVEQFCFSITFNSAVTNRYFKIVNSEPSTLKLDYGAFGVEIWIGEVEAYSSPIEGESTDTVDISDSIEGQNYTGYIVENIGLSDTIEGRAPSVDSTDDVDISDSIDTIVEYNPVNTNDLSFSDNITASTLRGLAEDTIEISDVIIGTGEFSEGSSDDLSLSDTAEAFIWTTELQRNQTVGGEKLKVRFFFSLVNDYYGASDVTIPISSFQYRTTPIQGSFRFNFFLSVTIPNLTEYLTVVNDRTESDMKLEMAFYQGNTEYVKEILCYSNDIDSIETTESIDSDSIKLTGTGTDINFSKNITITNYYSRDVDNNGKLNYKLSPPDLFLKSNDNITAGSDTFTAGEVSMNVSIGRLEMTVTEA